MTTEHIESENLKARFEDGDRPTGEDFARLIDSCHNTRQLTPVTITQSLSVMSKLTVDGDINTRDIAADGSKLDSLDSFVRNNSDSWEETEHILAISSAVETVSTVLSDNIITVNETLSTRIEAVNDTLTTKTETVNDTLSALIVDKTSTLDEKIDLDITQLQSQMETNTNTISVSVNNTDSRVDSAFVEIEEIEADVNILSTTVADNSASWGQDENTNTLEGLTDVVTTSIENNDVLKYNSADNTWYAARDLHGGSSSGNPAGTFVELDDTPASFGSGNPGEYVTITPAGDGLMFSSLLDNLEFNRLRDDFTDIETEVESNSGNWSSAHGWGDHGAAGYLTSYTETDPIFTAHVANNITQTNIDNWSAAHNWGDHGTSGYLTTETDPIFTAHVANNITQTNIDNWSAAHNWGDHGAAGYLTSYTETDPIFTAHVANNITQTNIDNWSAAHNWGDHGAVGYVTDVSDITSTLESNSGSWEDTHTHVKAVSSNWAVLDSNGVLMEDQIPELSITQTYTVQNPEEVATLNPVEGIQRGDIVIVTSTYDNLIAKTDSPAGVYNSSTKAYSGYSKLAKPDAYVTSVNNQSGHVELVSDNISDVDNDNKWMTVAEKQTIEQLDDTYINVTGDTMTGDLDTTARLLSGGRDLKDAFWVKGDNLAAIGTFMVDGEINASSYATKNTAGDIVNGITKDVNVGGNILHIVNGIIVGVTDET
jgi:hypothetical protein